MNGHNASSRQTPFEIARHIVSEAHRERVRLRALRPPRVEPASRAAAAPAGGRIHVVVGVDLSDGSRRALTWAAREAMAHQGSLTACWTGRLPASALSGGPDEPASARSDLDKIEEDLRAEIAEAAPDLVADVRVGPAVVEAGADELLELASGADLLVLACSSEGHWGRPSPVNVRRVIGRATCPVVLVP